MHIEKLKYYIDLYECRNFTETAKKNFISQAALSQFISSLENQFRLQFFDRSVNPIEPTEAGALFYDECKNLYRQYEKTVTKMNQMRDDVLPPLKIAYSSTADIQALLPIIPIFKSKYPHAELQLNKIKLKDTDDYLERDLCDVAISFSAEFVESPSIKYKILQQGKYRAMIGKGHPLFEHDSITTEELYKYPLIMLSEKVIGNLYEKMVDRAKLDGFEPIIEKTVDDLETEMFSIITEGYIGFAPESQSLAEYGDAIRLIPIVDSSHKYIIAAGYSKANKNPTLEAFLNII
ncbi:LysR family transcriptional regulator [Pseudobutyrivibrio sp.]|uniref:LysR family transcriptional regulator n=1 Tax=Pseudobutyrivibrio sp. TaxID=2014367 RepID=UPI001D4FD3BD|nr:LysR family transcriptional regulator [Pseudobutyrivibrio sp.]MBE5912384.1 LysR family transcriptional regulator [Pseudobutyrivibrio sp.]